MVRLPSWGRPAFSIFWGVFLYLSCGDKQICGCGRHCRRNVPTRRPTLRQRLGAIAEAGGKGARLFPLSFFGMGAALFIKICPGPGLMLRRTGRLRLFPFLPEPTHRERIRQKGFLEHFAFETRPVATHHSGENVFFVRIRATWWRLPPSRQQSGFNSWPPHPWQRSRPPEGGFRLRGTGTTG